MAVWKLFALPRQIHWAQQQLGKAWDSRPPRLRLNLLLWLTDARGNCPTRQVRTKENKDEEGRRVGALAHLSWGFPRMGKDLEAQETNCPINQAFSFRDSVLSLVYDLTPFVKPCTHGSVLNGSLHCEVLTRSSLLWSWILSSRSSPQPHVSSLVPSVATCKRLMRKGRILT